MSTTTRKIAGTVLLLVLLVVYSLSVPILAGAILPGSGRLTELVFYMIAGLAWVPAAAWIVSWMHR
jgi:Protein of unknown function (DUF2842)